ncbi:hypothetical protein IQ07DRAFT_658281, partial [Pyrenochaeta sp. DS3sAY3a]
MDPNEVTDVMTLKHINSRTTAQAPHTQRKHDIYYDLEHAERDEYDANSEDTDAEHAKQDVEYEKYCAELANSCSLDPVTTQSEAVDPAAAPSTSGGIRSMGMNNGEENGEKSETMTERRKGKGKEKVVLNEETPVDEAGEYLETARNRPLTSKFDRYPEDFYKTLDYERMDDNDYLRIQLLEVCKQFQECRKDALELHTLLQHRENREHKRFLKRANHLTSFAERFIILDRKSNKGSGAPEKRQKSVNRDTELARRSETSHDRSLHDNYVREPEGVGTNCQSDIEIWEADLNGFRKTFLDPNTTKGKEHLAIENLVRLEFEVKREQQRAADELKRIKRLNKLNQERANFEMEKRKSQAELKAKHLEEARLNASNAYNLGFKDATDKRDAHFDECLKELKVELRERFLKAAEGIRASKDKEFEEERQKTLDEFQRYRNWMKDNYTCRRCR